jgi:RNA polymerase sigma-70 factor (ECF subfamily)
MNDEKVLTERFEADRARLKGVAYRMLGSLSEAEDAVQQSWLKLSRAGTGGVENLSGWLTTVVARVCLDMLRTRRSRSEEPVGTEVPQSAASASAEPPADPEQEAALADSVGLALLVVLETLDPAERLAFVLHEMFELPFEEIASIVGRSAAACRQLASRARRRVKGGASAVSGAEHARQREVVQAYLAASRGGDLGALLAVLDPDVEVRADRWAVPAGTPTEARGAENVARRALAAGNRARFAELALVDGAVGVIVAPRGRLRLVLQFTVERGKVARVDVTGDPERLAALEVAVLS